MVTQSFAGRVPSLSAAASGRLPALFELELLRAILTATDLEAMTTAIAQAAQVLTSSDRAVCTLVDRHTGGSPRRIDSIARTSQRADEEILGPRPGNGVRGRSHGAEIPPASDRRLSVSIPPGSGDAAIAVMVASRATSATPFSEGDQNALTTLATAVSSALASRIRLAKLEQEAIQSRTPRAQDGFPLYREEALRQKSGAADRYGESLNLSPQWISWSYRILLFLFCVAILYGSLGRVHEYAAGFAVVQDRRHVEVATASSGVVSAVLIAPGQSVAEEQLLVRLDDAEEVAEARRLRGELEVALRARLREPRSPPSGSPLSGLRERLRHAEARLAERSLVAPSHGTIRDVRIRRGQLLVPGQVALTFEPSDALEAPSILAMFPGRYRPEIEPGMPIRFELEGHRNSYLHLSIASVSEGIVGPAEARRFIGQALGDTIPLGGSVVFVRAELPSSRFESGGRQYLYHDGLQGRAEVRLSSEPVLFALIPRLASLLPERSG